jgi:hypothetical protein
MIRKVLLALLAVIMAATIGGYGKETVEASGDQEATKQTGSSEGSPQRITEDRVVYGTSFVNPLVEISGKVYIGQKSFVAGNTVLKAQGGRRIEIGNQTNAQDNVAVKALKRGTTVDDGLALPTKRSLRTLRSGTSSSLASTPGSRTRLLRTVPSSYTVPGWRTSQYPRTPSWGSGRS